MLQISIPAGELWDEKSQEFVSVEPRVLELEHSLVSLSKWESKWNKAFLSKEPKTFEETIDYIKCMTLTQNVKPETYMGITNEHINAVNNYIEAPMTATTISNRNGKKSNEIVTSELIYYWMISLQIPFECQYWHLNRLMMLIQVCNIKNTPPKKMSKRSIMSRNAALNAVRRKQFNSNG